MRHRLAYFMFLSNWGKSWGGLVVIIGIMYWLFDFFFLFKLFISMEKVQIVDLSQLHFRLIPIESLSKEFLDGHFDSSIFDLLS